MMDGFACETTLMAAVSFGDIEEPKQRWIGKETLNQARVVNLTFV